MSSMLAPLSRTVLARSRCVPLVGVMSQQTMLMSSKPTNKKGKDAEEKGSDKEIETLLSFYNAVNTMSRVKVEFPPEVQAEHKKIADEFNRQDRRRKNKMEYDLTNKIWMKQEALRALKNLPPHLLAHAQIIETIPVPADRPYPYFQTPPIEGFNHSLYTDSERFSASLEDDLEEENPASK